MHVIFFRINWFIEQISNACIQSIFLTDVCVCVMNKSARKENLPTKISEQAGRKGESIFFYRKKKKALLIRVGMKIYSMDR
jgi:hypothetical protein